MAPVAPVGTRPADELNARPSADGRFICYQSDETGRWDIHVAEIATGRRWIVSSDECYSPPSPPSSSGGTGNSTGGGTRPPSASSTNRRAVSRAPLRSFRLTLG